MARSVSSPQLTTSRLSEMPPSHAWNVSSVGAHSPVPPKYRWMSEVRPVKEPGNGPERLELPSSRNPTRLVRLPSSAGISPVSWLPSSHNTSRLERLPSSAGISPLSWLTSSHNSSRLERRPNSAGISPLSWLL